MKIVICGASGFAGTTVTHWLSQCEDFDIVPVIGSGGSAWALAKDNVNLVAADVMNRTALAKVLKGCDAVVNCTRDSNKVMLEGLKNLLEEAKAGGISRFIHLSSVAVYGDPPHPDSATENAPCHPEKGSYGALKLRQDDMVAAAHRKNGMQTIMLCLPNISGPNSPYLVSLIDCLKDNSFCLMDDGSAPCCLVDVTNLAAATEAALRAPSLPGARLFITDDGEISWHRIVERLSACLDTPHDVPRISCHELVAACRTTAPNRSLWSTIKYLVSSDIREALRKDPNLAAIDISVRDLISKSAWLEDKMRLSIEGPTPIKPLDMKPNYHWRLCEQQLRGVLHSAARAKETMGYRPVLSFAQSMDRFETWYRTIVGVGDGDWSLLREL